MKILCDFGVCTGKWSSQVRLAAMETFACILIDRCNGDKDDDGEESSLSDVKNLIPTVDMLIYLAIVWKVVSNASISVDVCICIYISVSEEEKWLGINRLLPFLLLPLYSGWERGGEEEVSTALGCLWNEVLRESTPAHEIPSEPYSFHFSPQG